MLTAGLGCRWSTAPWTAAVQTVLQDALALRTRCNAGGIGEHGLASARAVGSRPDRLKAGSAG